MKKKKLILFLVIFFIAVLFFLIGGKLHGTPTNSNSSKGGIIDSIVGNRSTEEELDEKFIKVNPLDLSQVTGLSKYRSCVGHDYRFPTYPDGDEEPTPRSMKHYVSVERELAGKNGVVKAIAPFDGEISDILTHDPGSKPDDRQVWLTPETNSDGFNKWHFIFFHIDLKDELEEGSKVKAGEVIGTAYLSRGPENTTENFDIAVKYTRALRKPMVDVPFAHATEEVLQEYEEYGVTLSDLVISKEYRAQNPCPTTDESTGGDVYFPADEDPYENVSLDKSGV